MSSIILADGKGGEELEKAASELRKQGHDVRIVTHYPELADLLKHFTPDVLIFSFWLTNFDVIEMLTYCSKRDCRNKPAQIMIVERGPDGTIPGYSMWQAKEIENFVLQPYLAWHIVMAVGQVLNRRIVSGETR